MEIVLKPKEALVNVIAVSVSPEDYKTEYLAELKKYTKQASLPGFRAGKVPFGLIQKRFGPSVLAEQINQKVGRELAEYIQTQNIQFLAKPFLASSNLNQMDASGDQSFQFEFEIGLEPEFTLNTSALKAYNSYAVTVEDSDLDDLIKRYQYQMGEQAKAEVVDFAAAPNYLVAGIVSAPSPAEGSPELPFMRFFSFNTDLRPELKDAVKGKREKDAITFVPVKLFKDEFEGSQAFRLETAEYRNVANLELKFEVRQIFTCVPAALNAEFYAKALPGMQVDNELQFREELKRKMTVESQTMADNYLNNRIRTDLLKSNVFELPDRILQRWLAEEFNDFKEPGSLEQRYAQYRDELRFHLIRKKLQQQYPELKVSEDDVRNDLKQRLQSFMPQLDAQPHGQAEEGANAEGHTHVHTHDHAHTHDHDHDHDHAHDHDHDHAHDHSHEHAHASASPIEGLLDNFMKDEKLFSREFNALQHKRFYDVVRKDIVKLEPKTVSFNAFERAVAAEA